MAQLMTLPDLSTRLELRRPEKKFSEADYWAFCEANPELRLERTAEGEIVVAPPAGGESDYRNTKVVTQLDRWAEKDGSGTAFGPTVQFFLPDGSGLSPDAAWVSNESLSKLTRQQRKKFLRLTPEFVVEVLSPTDDLKAAKTKMTRWITNGVRLAWLIDGDSETVYIYRKNQPAQTRRHITEVAGEGPVAGFVLDLRRIWRGL